MNRIYLMPKIIILTLTLVLLTKKIDWYFILAYILVSMAIVAIYEILSLYIQGKYYYKKMVQGKEVDQNKMYSIVHRYMKMVNMLLRVDIEVENYDRFTKDKNYLIIPNHQSNEDALVVMETFKDRICFVSKYSMSEVVLVKEWMNLIGCLFLKKDDMRSQIIVMNEVVEKLKKGENVVIFPEGRRSYSSTMNEFKSGTFKMATKTQVDILPVTLNHVYKFRHRFPWKKTNVKVYIHEPISYEQYKDLSTQEIADMVQQIVASKIE